MTTPDIIETVNVSRHVAWLPWAVSYFFLIGVSVAGAFLSLPAFLVGKTGCERMGRVAVLTMLSCAVVAPVALLADLHQPGRFWHFYAHFTPWSWMSIGSVVLPAYVGLAVVYGWLVMRPGRFRALVRPLAALTALAAVGIVVYTGMEVMVVRSRPLWHTPTLPVMFLFTALTGGAGMALVLNRVVSGFEAAAERRLYRALALFSGLVLLNGGVWLALGLTGVGAEADALAALSGSEAWMTVAGWATLTAVLLLAIGVVAPRNWGWLAGLVALHSAWMFRWTVFIGGQTVPKTGAGFYVYHLPLGSEGLAGIVGVFGLWVAVVAVLTMLSPWSARGNAAADTGDAGRRAAPPAAAE